MDQTCHILRSRIIIYITGRLGEVLGTHSTTSTVIAANVAAVLQCGFRAIIKNNTRLDLSVN